MKVKAHEVGKIGTAFLSEGKYWILPDHLLCLLLRDVTHRYMDTFTINPVVVAGEVL